MDLLDDDELLDLRDRARRTDPAAVAREERERRRVALPASNPALEAWAGEGGQETPAEAGRTSAPAPCHVCRNPRAKARCRQCHRPACAEHLWVMFGLCTRCATDERVSRWHAEAEPEDANWLDKGG